MATEVFSGTRLFTPDASSQSLLRVQAERRLRDAYPTGTYSGAERINEIVKFQFSFYNELLASHLPLVASIEFLEFLLSQYDAHARVEWDFKSGRLPPGQARTWRDLGSHARRAIKYLAEIVTRRIAPLQLEFPLEARIEARDVVWICADQVVRLSEASDQTYLLFPDRTTLEIFPEGTSPYVQLRLADYRDSLFERVSSSRDHEKRFLPHPDFQVDVDRHCAVLNEAFQKSFGAKYDSILSIFSSLIDEMPGTEAGVAIGSKQHIVQQFADHLNVSESAAGRLLAGFTITKNAMDAEGRVPWKPNQEHRAYYRGLFEVAGHDEPLLIWSREMARECLFHVATDVVAQRLAPEWSTDSIERAVATLSNEYGRWFEMVVFDNLSTLGFFGLRSRTSFGLGDCQIAVPKEVGEIDYLGYLPGESLLFIGECKATSIGTESRSFRNELKQFTAGEHSYAARFRRKIDWVKANWQALCRALESDQVFAPIRGNLLPTAVASAMITRRPTYASEGIHDFPCISLAEFRLEYERNGRWPWHTGVDLLAND